MNCIRAEAKENLLIRAIIFVFLASGASRVLRGDLMPFLREELPVFVGVMGMDIVAGDAVLLFAILFGIFTGEDKE